MLASLTLGLWLIHRQAAPAPLSLEILGRMMGFLPPSSKSIASLACVQRLWREPCQKELFTCVSLSTNNQVQRFTRSLLFHMGPKNPEPMLKLQLHVKHVILEKDNRSPCNPMDEKEFHHHFAWILPLFQKLEQLTYTSAVWDSFVFLRHVGNYICKWGPLSLTQLNVVVSFLPRL